MVQLSAAELGVPTSNANASIADAITQATQGFVQGMKLKMMRESADREQQDFNQRQAERQAAASGAALLGTAGQFDAQKTPEQQLQLDALDYGTKQAGQALMGTPLAPAGAALSSGMMSSSKPLGQAMDWHNLKQHQSEFMAQAAKAAAAMDPRLAGPFMAQARQAMQEDAANLRRSHVTSWAHDGIVNGMFFPPNPADGSPIPDEGIASKVTEIGNAIETGTMDPEAGQHMLQQIADQATNARVEVRQRKSLVMHARQTLDKAKQEGKLPTDDAEHLVDLYDTGQIDKQAFMADWPDLSKGYVPYINAYGRKEYLPPEQVTAKREEDALTKYLLQEYKRAQIEQAQAAAEAKRQEPGLKLQQIEARERGLDIQEASTTGNLEARTNEQAAAAESRSANLSLGKRNAEAALNAKVLEIAGKDQTWMDADPGAERDAIEAAIRAKLEPKTQEPIKSSTNDAEVKLIGDMKAQGKSRDEIKAAVLKLRGGK